VINQVVEAVEDAAIAQGYTLLLCSTRAMRNARKAYIDLLTQRMAVDGVLYVSPRAAPEDVKPPRLRPCTGSTVQLHN